MSSALKFNRLKFGEKKRAFVKFILHHLFDKLGFPVRTAHSDARPESEAMQSYDLHRCLMICNMKK